MRKITALLLAAALMLSLTACAGTQQGVIAAGENEIIDGAGRKVSLPDEPEKATCASVYAVSVPFITALGLSERTVAVNTKTKFWLQADEKLPDKSIGRGTVDLEALAACAPDVLIHRSNDPQTVEAVERLGVQVLCITVEDMDDIEYTLRLMGEYFGVSVRAEEVIGWLEAKLEYIDAIVETIPQEERKTALVMGGELGRVAGDDMLQTWMIERAGGIPAVDEGSDHNWINAGIEKVFAWDPQVIFCTGSTGRDYDDDDMMSDAAWSDVRAVKSGSIYVIPARLDPWDMPGISCVIGTMYMLYAMYPQYFTAQQLGQQIDEYYTFMFGRSFDADTLGYDLSTMDW